MVISLDAGRVLNDWVAAMRSESHTGVAISISPAICYKPPETLWTVLQIPPGFGASFD